MNGAMPYNDRKGGIPVKKLLYIVFLLMVLAFSVPAFAESAVIPADDDDITIMLEEAFAEIGLDYCNVILNSEKEMFVIDMAIDGLTQSVIAFKYFGFDETYEPWAKCRTNLQQMHRFVLDMFKSVGREDLRLILNMVNDDVYLREDYENIQYNPLLSVGIFGNVHIDVMSE